MHHWQPVETAARRFIHKTAQDHTAAYASKAALFLFISFFPFAMLLLTLIRYLPFSQEELHTFLTELLPDELDLFLTEVVSELYGQSGKTLLSLTVLTTLWAASKGFVALLQGLDMAYEVRQKRNYALLRLVSVVYTVAFLLFVVAALCILVFGNSLAGWLHERFPQLQRIAWGVLSWRNLVGGLLLFFFFLLIYRTLPRRHTRLVAEIPGAILSTVGWIGFSSLFSYYIDHFSSYANLYGSLTAVVLVILWLYACVYILLIGAELNCMRQNGDLSALRRWPNPQKAEKPKKPREPVSRR